MRNCGKNSILYLRSVFNLSFRNCSYWTTFDGMLSAHMFKMKVETTRLLPFIYDNQSENSAFPICLYIKLWFKSDISEKNSNVTDVNEL